jgi:hypothetical protein
MHGVLRSRQSGFSERINPFADSTAASLVGVATTEVALLPLEDVDEGKHMDGGGLLLGGDSGSVAQDVGVRDCGDSVDRGSKGR